MNALLRLVPCLAAAFLAAAPLGAQVREKIPPPEFVRETVADADGRLQWKPFDVACEACHGRGVATCQGCANFDVPNCTECGGTKTARCRVCLGTKKLLDPLVDVHCPYCAASGWNDCPNCGGVGYFIVTDKDDGSRRQQDCGGCKKKGRWECLACESEGRLATVRIKRKPPGEADLEDLEEMHEVLAGCLAAMEAFEPASRASESEDMIEEVVKKPGRKYEPLKDMLAVLEETLKSLTKVAAAYEGYEAKKTHQFLLMKDRTIYLLQHNVRALDQCIARAKHNAGLEGGK